MLRDAMIFAILKHMTSAKKLPIYVIMHDIRSTHNVGSVLRTAEGLGIEHVYMSGYTPYPKGHSGDIRLPHIAHKNHEAIRKTALGAENTVRWSYEPSIKTCIDYLKREGVTIVGLEQATQAKQLHTYTPDKPIALIIGNEVSGLDQKIMDQCDTIVEIPMLGQKESYNVSVATAMALHWFRYGN